MATTTKKPPVYGCGFCNPAIRVATELPGICPQCGKVWLDGTHIADGWAPALYQLMIGERSHEAFAKVLDSHGLAAHFFMEFGEWAFVVAPSTLVAVEFDWDAEAFTESRMDLREAGGVQ